MSLSGQIVRIDPPASIPGGEVLLECSGLNSGRTEPLNAEFGGLRAHLVGASANRIMALVPDLGTAGRVDVLLESNGLRSSPANMLLAEKMADDLHLVANPAFDPDSQSLIVTRSGSRGQKMPVSLFRIDSDGEIEPLTGDIANPTGVAFDRSGQLYVSSRLDGIVYRVTAFKEVIPFAHNLGVATGIAFDESGTMYVGDRNGTIYRVDSLGESEAWAVLEPSVSAYHMAFGPEGDLYVTGPTVSSSDVITRIDQAGRTSVYYKGLGRPQGLAFDGEGNLYVAASHKGRRGVIRVPRGGMRAAELVVAGMNVVGLAFNGQGDMAIATNDAVYRLPLGVKGTLVGG
jgi:sugar lactone lactonase YvrE